MPDRRPTRPTPLRAAVVAAATLVLMLAFVLAPQTPTASADGQMCGALDVVPVDGGRYTVQNNRFGVEAQQCVSARAGGFTLDTADGQIAPGGPPKSYPSIVAGCHWGRCSSAPGLPVRAADVGGARTAVSITRAPGSWNAAYDLWFNSSPGSDGQNDGTEIMIWIDASDAPDPIGRVVGTVDVEGASWTVWQGDIGWDVVSFVREQGATTVDLALAPFVGEAITRGATEPGDWMTSVQFGFEPWSGGAGLAVRGFSFEPGGARAAGQEGEAADHQDAGPGAPPAAADGAGARDGAGAAVEDRADEGATERADDGDGVVRRTTGAGEQDEGGSAPSAARDVPEGSRAVPAPAPAAPPEPSAASATTAPRASCRRHPLPRRSAGTAAGPARRRTARPRAERAVPGRPGHRRAGRPAGGPVVVRPQPGLEAHGRDAGPRLDRGVPGHRGRRHGRRHRGAAAGLRRPSFAGLAGHPDRRAPGHRVGAVPGPAGRGRVGRHGPGAGAVRRRPVVVVSVRGPVRPRPGRAPGAPSGRGRRARPRSRARADGPPRRARRPGHSGSGVA